MEQFSATLHSVDVGILVAYFIFTIGLGVWLSRRHQDAEDYFLAGRSMIWPFIGISLFASNISSQTLVGLAGSAYSTGIAVFNYEWMAAIILVFFAIFMLPFVLRAKVYTMPEYLERRFDRRARAYFAGLTLFLNIVVDTAGSLYAGALILKLIFPDFPMWQIITLLAVVAGVYTILGGLSAVMYTDAIQGALLIIGSVIISWIAFDQVGGWSTIVANVSPEKLSLVRPLDDPSMPWLGLITGVPLLGFYFWCTNQFMVQRVLSAKDETHGRLGGLFAGLLKLPVLFIMVLPGTFAILLYPDLPKGDLVYPTLMFDLLPVGLLGLVLAGFVAALMSQIDSTLNSASTLITMDFIRHWKPDLTSEQLMKVGRISTFIFMLAAVLWAPYIGRFESLFEYLQQVLSYAVPPVVAMFLMGIFWKRANAQGAVAALIVGVLAGAALFTSNVVLEWTNIHFLYVAPILFLVSCIALAVVSLTSAAPREEDVAPFTWTPAFYHAETEALKAVPWYLNYRVWSIGLLALTAWLVISFW